MWVCSKCNARVEPDFDVCWRCGTTYQGEEDPDFVAADEAPPIDDSTDYLRLEVGKLPEGEIAEPPLGVVTCFETNDVAEAKFVADVLAAEGIPATLQNTNSVRGMPATAYSLYPCCVVVRDEDLPRARSVIEGYRERRRGREARGN